MKLLNCTECHDVIALHQSNRRCLCGASAGRYQTDGLHVEITGPARVLGFANSEYLYSLKAPNIPYETYYKWFPIRSDKENYVIVLSKEEFNRIIDSSDN